jgi:hypothetical protein
MSSNVETSNTDPITSNVETSNTDPITSNVETSNTDPITSNVETSNTDPITSNVETSNTDPITSNVETSNTDPITSNVDPLVSNVETSNTDPITSNVETTPQPVITITRYELYPKGEPTCYVVGFVVSCPSGQKTMYRDTQVPLDQAQGKTEQEIAQIAYSSLKESVDAWVCTEMAKPKILGSTFIPSSV